MALQRVANVHPNDITSIPFRPINLPSGVTIGVVSASSSPAGLAFTVTASAGVVYALTSGGVDNTLYVITVVINFSNGERRNVQVELYVNSEP